MSRRRQRRREKLLRHAAPVSRDPVKARPIIREAARVKRLAYTRSQAAEALGISRSTLTRLLPFLEIVELPWGTKLVPVDELERLLRERRRSARRRPEPATPGRPRVIPPELAQQIRSERAAGKSFASIAADLNASGTRTAHGGRRWWPSTVRSVLFRSP
jgi:Bacterial regulatory protein, Fis family/Recombinase